MKRKSVVLATAALLALSSNSFAAVTTYVFETITVINMDRTVPSLVGVLRNTTTPIEVGFEDDSGDSNRFVVSRCLPLFMAMVDKPGKYYLWITMDPDRVANDLIHCKLAVR